MKKLSIIIVTWNCKDDVIACLESLQKLMTLPIELETIVVDNGSEDSTSKYLQDRKSEFADIGLEIITNTFNAGLSSATNQAYERAKGWWILLCNPDIAFNDGVRKLLDYGNSNPGVMITADMVGPDGKLQRVIHRRFPTLTRVFFEFGSFGSYLDEKIMNHVVRKNYCYQSDSFPPIASIESPGASFLLLNREVISKLGIIFDTRFPVWWNDVDLAKRAEELGITRIILSDVKVEHGLGHGSRSLSEDAKRNLFCRSMILYAGKWRMHPHFLRFLFVADAIIGVPVVVIVRSRSWGLIDSIKRSTLMAVAQVQGVLRA